MTWIKKSTIVRTISDGRREPFRYGEFVAPGRAGRLARDVWFSVPPRMPELPVPEGGQPFEVEAQGHLVRGLVWGRGPIVYLMHGWGGRGSQFAAMVAPLVETGHRVVMFDAPSHGDSDHGPAGNGTSNGVEFARALDAVFCRFGPAEAVIAHSMGTISTYLAIRFGWLGSERLVFVAPMVEFTSLLDQFQQASGFGPRTRRVLDREIEDFVGLSVRDFDARVQARHVDPRPTLVISDRGDRQTPYAAVVDFAKSIGAQLITTEGLGHAKVLRDPALVRTVVEFVNAPRERAASA